MHIIHLLNDLYIFQSNHSNTSAVTGSSDEDSEYKSDPTHNRNHSRTLTSSDVDSNCNLIRRKKLFRKRRSKDIHMLPKQVKVTSSVSSANDGVTVQKENDDKLHPEVFCEKGSASEVHPVAVNVELPELLDNVVANLPDV